MAQVSVECQQIESFDIDSIWMWSPWVNRSNNQSTAIKSRHSAYKGSFGLFLKSDSYFINKDVKVGHTGQSISCYLRFQDLGRAYLGFGIDSLQENGYFVCVDPSTESFHFTKTPNYTYPSLKSVHQNYKMNVWYKVEIIFNSPNSVTANLFFANNLKLLNTIKLDTLNLILGNISFNGLAVHLDEIMRCANSSTNKIKPLQYSKIGQPFILPNIQFESGNNKLLESSFDELNNLLNYLKSNPNYKVKVTGHTDSTGQDSLNNKLSYLRAEAVANYLISNGINKQNVSYIGLGSSKPLLPNTTYLGRKANRRVEFYIY